jgi:hypothetical protein
LPTEQLSAELGQDDRLVDDVRGLVLHLRDVERHRLAVGLRGEDPGAAEVPRHLIRHRADVLALQRSTADRIGRVGIIATVDGAGASGEEKAEEATEKCSRAHES